MLNNGFEISIEFCIFIHPVRFCKKKISFGPISIFGRLGGKWACKGKKYEQISLSVV